MSDVLKELAKQDKRWRAAAFNICGCADLTGDLVNDMYIKIYEYQYTEIKASLIYKIIKNLFIDHCKRKEICVEEFQNHKQTQLIFEPNEKENELTKRFYNLDWRKQELILESYDYSLREIQDKFPLINYAYAYRQIKEGVKEVLGKDYDTKYKNSRNKRI